MNNTYGDPSGVDPFDVNASVLPGQSGAYTGDSSVIPSFNFFGNVINNYNFAIARVRLRGAPGTSSSPVKVFFRLWTTETIDSDYQPSTTYASHLDASNLPDWPLPDPGSTTIPFFATGNAPNFSDPNNPELGTNGVNNRPITLSTGDWHWAYFGCFLNVYDQTYVVNGTAVPALLVGTHHCLVAQIAYDDAPILNSAGITMSPGNCDKLAQRNLQVTRSDNPGSAATHRVPQTFDLRPSEPAAAQPAPDELMIVWGNTPPGAVASIYWPQVDSSQVLDLARRLYGLHALSATDAHTIKCEVTNGVTYVPIPEGNGDNFAGLFIVDLPQSVVVGQEFNIIVRRVSHRREEMIEAVKLAKGGAKHRHAGRATAAAQAETKPGQVKHAERNWRYVVGAFQVKVPVSDAKQMLPEDENTLSIFKWRLQQMPASNRWHPVLKRLVSYLSVRVTGLGGDPDAIKPSPGGIPLPIGPRHGREAEDELTGKVRELLYDCFGDFEGFVLATCDGEHRFANRERAIEEVVIRACTERLRLTVRFSEHSHHHHHRRILGLVVRCC
jgi:hypothetical protein